MNIMKIGMKVKNKICPTLTGTVKKVYPGGTAVIKINDEYITSEELFVSTENWEECR